MNRPQVGLLTEPDPVERDRFLREVKLNAGPLTDRFRAAEALARACDRAALTTRYGVELPEARANELKELEAVWRANRLRGTALLRT